MNPKKYTVDVFVADFGHLQVQYITVNFGCLMV